MRAKVDVSEAVNIIASILCEEHDSVDLALKLVEMKILNAALPTYQRMSGWNEDRVTEIEAALEVVEKQVKALSPDLPLPPDDF